MHVLLFHQAWCVMIIVASEVDDANQDRIHSQLIIIL